MASGVYNILKQQLLKKVIDFLNDTIKVMLLNSSHAFAASSVTNSVIGDVSANEVTGTNYSAGGATLGNKSTSVDNSGNKGVFDADDVVWASSTISAYHAVIYDDTTASKYLIASIDFGGVQASVNGNFTIQWSASGILTLS